MPAAVSREKHSCKLCLAGREKAALSNVKTMYDLQGRKVEKPTKGIYIINGKKTFIK